MVFQSLAGHIYISQELNTGSPNDPERIKTKSELDVI